MNKMNTLAQILRDRRLDVFVLVFAALLLLPPVVVGQPGGGGVVAEIEGPADRTGRRPDVAAVPKPLCENPGTAAASESRRQAHVLQELVKGVTKADLTDPEKAVRLEALKKEFPGVFCWDLHNALRHCLGEDLEKSMVECDTIFQHCPKDGYILAILSGWNLDKDPASGAMKLQQTSQRYRRLKFLRAACLLKAGEVYLDLGMKEKGTDSLKRVAEISDPDLGTFAALARHRLDKD
jgi:hypothetical protein